ncbi:hypothetical protein H5410_012646 [Solanum commersonii]|uniref:Uncharacterized protein n=1 Tax=Solanum commersonii TaxID=4109 RepID=A0A9J6ASR7_SOLCO|nr:hypothetical protein H5410_012646 [Solanum commersonii]
MLEFNRVVSNRQTVVKQMFLGEKIDRIVLLNNVHLYIAAMCKNINLTNLDVVLPSVSSCN